MRFWKPRKQLGVAVWRVEIFYPLCPIVKKYEMRDPLEALKRGLKEGLRTHGLVDQNSFDVVWEVFQQEERDPATGQLWFRVRRMRISE